jgi:hypothetical protein
LKTGPQQMHSRLSGESASGIKQRETFTLDAALNIPSRTGPTPAFPSDDDSRCDPLGSGTANACSPVPAYLPGHCVDANFESEGNCVARFVGWLGADFRENRPYLGK